MQQREKYCNNGPGTRVGTEVTDVNGKPTLPSRGACSLEETEQQMTQNKRAIIKP